MRLLAALALIGFSAAQAQPAAGSESNIHCVERLRMPAYPKLADAARVAGLVTAKVTLRSDGSIQSTVLDMGVASVTAKKLFAPAVDEALRASAFGGACGGKSVTLIFHFVLGEELDSNSLQQAVSFGYPNRFWISVPPKIIQP